MNSHSYTSPLSMYTFIPASSALLLLQPIIVQLIQPPLPPLSVGFTPTSTVCDPVQTELLQRTQRHRGTGLVCREPEPRIKRFSEGGVEGVEVDEFIRRDSVEGQGPGRGVHIHCYCVGVKGRKNNLSSVIFPATECAFIRAKNTPGVLVHP